MKSVILLAVLVGTVSGVPTEEPQGWFVPLQNGNFQWMTVEQSKSETEPLKMKSTDIKFFLYTKSNPSIPHQLYLNNSESLFSSKFDNSHPTRFIIHGWTNDYKSPVSRLLRRALLNTDSYNVIIVDWSVSSMTINYVSARRSVESTGRILARFFDFLNSKTGMPFNNLTLIGHSLGSHIAGYAGKYVTKGKINTFIGLDPAYPLFKYSDCSRRLCNTDATYVESIHTAGGKLGFLQPIEMASFYSNGGRTQLGCVADISGVCSHLRSYCYLAEAIERSNFKGIQCPDYIAAVSKNCENSDSHINMGNSYGINGVYYGPVNRRPPYGMG